MRPATLSLLTLLIPSAFAWGDELRRVGILGNSGESEGALVTFAGETAAGFGPVVDRHSTIWERGGARQLNRYALDGRLLARFPLPDRHDDRGDRMTLAGDHLVLKIRDELFRLRVDAESGTAPERILGNVGGISVNAITGRVVIARKGQDALSWLDPDSMEQTHLLDTVARPDSLQVDPDGTIYGFQGNQVYAWKDGQPLGGFPRRIDGERPQKVGRYWYTHAWHGTIKRMNERFEPEPGVVLGGASGSFIGYLPQSVDLTNGRGIAHVRGDIFAVSGMSGVVQLLRWNEQGQNFEVVRRLGSLPDLTGVAIDRAGNIWTPGGSWHWDATGEAPLSLGDKEPDIHAQPVVLNGQTLCLLKRHYNYVQLASGSFFDPSGWSHLETRGLDGFDLPESVSGATLIPDGDGWAMLFADQEGELFRMGITDRGQPRTKPEAVPIAGLRGCTSLAWFDEKLIAGVEGAVHVYGREGSRSWKQLEPLLRCDGKAYVHSDGHSLVVSDSAAGNVHVFTALDSVRTSHDQLAEPGAVAIHGDRIALYEAGRQRLVKLELHHDADTPSVPLPKLATAPNVNQVPGGRRHSDVEFQELSRPGGLPLSVAVTADPGGLTVSLRTVTDPIPEVTLGVANNRHAYILRGTDAHTADGRFEFRLPKGDWGTLRLAVAVALPNEWERFAFRDGRAIHAPFSEDPLSWAPFDLDTYQELVEARRQEIRITFDQPVAGKATIVVEDEQGNRVRNLVSGRSFTAGQHTIVWDGLDEAGKLASPGRYGWRGITHPGITPDYKMNFANGGEPTTSSWGPNHSTFQAAASNGKLIFFAAPVTEGGWALVALDRDGHFVQGYEHLHGYGIQHDAIAADDRYLYCAQDGFSWGGNKGIDSGSDSWKATWKVTVVRYDIETGRLVEFPDKQRAIEVDSMEVGPGSSHPNLDEYNLGGLAVDDGKLYIGLRDKKAVLVLDANSGKRLGTIPLPGVRDLAARDGVVALTDHGIFRLPGGKQITAAEGLDPRGITIAPNGDLLVSDGKSHQIHRFSEQGKRLGVIGTPGGAYKGKYDPARMVNPRGLTFGPDGKLWVTEDRWNPKRVLAWELGDTNRLAYEKFGMPHYGGDGSGFDPENPNRWIGLGCFWNVDVAGGTARPTHILSIKEGHFGHYEPQGYQFFRQDGRTFVCARGKICLISEVLPDGTIHDLAATAGTHHFAYGCEWDPPQAYLDAFYAKWPEKRVQEKPGRKGDGKPWSQRGMGVLWVDRNGDGEAQQEEFDFSEGEEYGGGAWGHLQHSLTFVMPVATEGKVSVVTLEPTRFLPNGVPDYGPLEEAIAGATPIALTPGYKRSGVATVQDRFGRFILNSDPEMNAYIIRRTGIKPIPDDGHSKSSNGAHLWSFPNRWSDVHGSHDAPLPKPGVMQGTMAILGVAPFDEESDVIFLNGNHGRCFLLTTDGLYLDEAFVDVRVSYLTNEYRLGGEIFGGSFGRSQSEGTYYVQIGHGPYRIYELKGLREARRMSGTIDVTREQILAAQQQTLRRISRQQESREVSIPGTVRWDKDGRFRVEIDVKRDDTRLHLTYRVQDSSPWTNNGRDWSKLFATGDSVDFQFATDPNADPRRRNPVIGDKRLSIAPLDGKPIAILYEHRLADGTEGNAIEFTSPWRAEKVQNVQRLTDVDVDVEKVNGGYVVRAHVPLASLGWNPTESEPYRVDFGVTFGNAEGTDTNLRSYWSNGSTGLVDDIPGEIMLSPNLWGEARFRASTDQ